jgi:hypothetical protein
MRRGGELVIGGAIMLLTAGLLWMVPGIFAKVSLEQGHAICGSAIGALGSLISSQVSHACGTVGLESYGVGLLALAGIGVAVWGAVLMRRPA